MVELTLEPVDPEALRRAVEDPALGGVVVFVGEVRAVTEGRETSRLEYEAYEEMALEQMRAIACQAREMWAGKVAIAHRLGELRPGDVAVVAAAACPHRSQAFECCRFLIDRVKDDVPIWKREFGPDGEAWVEGDRLVESEGGG